MHSQCGSEFRYMTSKGKGSVSDGFFFFLKIMITLMEGKRRDGI